MISFLSRVLVNNYKDRVIGRVDPHDNNGIGVSTCFTPDESYETALLDAEAAHPVERYETEEDAKVGHDKWVAFASNGHGESITRLGLKVTGNVTEVYTLVRVMNGGASLN